MDVRILWVLAGLTGAAALWAVLGALRATRGPARPRRAQSHEVTADDSRIALRAEQPRPATPGVAETPFIAAPASPNGDTAFGAAPQVWTPETVSWLLADERPAPARTVLTPDGPMVLTTPPFKLRRSIMSARERDYARAVAVRMPSGFVVCPQVRLDALLTPTSPKDRPIDDWRNWRRRVRLRAVDLVICRLPDWAPVLALEIEPAERRAGAFQQDRMIDEALAEVGLPLLRCSGDPAQDWAMIAPYLAAPGAEARPAPTGPKLAT